MDFVVTSPWFHVEIVTAVETQAQFVSYSEIIA
jgi:hypothetical protein